MCGNKRRQQSQFGAQFGYQQPGQQQLVLVVPSRKEYRRQCRAQRNHGCCRRQRKGPITALVTAIWGAFQQRQQTQNARAIEDAVQPDVNRQQSGVAYNDILEDKWVEEKAPFAANDDIVPVNGREAPPTYGQAVNSK